MQSLEARRAALETKGRIRELVFGMQDGTMSIVGLLAGMQGATRSQALVLVAGATAVLAGAFSMAAGSYLSSRAEKDILDRERADAAKLAESEPYLAQEGILDALTREGLPREHAYKVVRLLSSRHKVLIATFNEKVFGLGELELSNPMKGAIVMALSFIAGGLLPLIPYLLIRGPIAIWVSGAAAALTLFGVGAFKGFLAGQPRARSGVLFFTVAAGSAVIGYLVGLFADWIAPGAAHFAGGV
jgi:VIT1/CCC1 family predicted Fe2+/Mn2+ transporter